MRNGLCALAVISLIWTGFGVPARAQSLADVARKEAERRKTVKDDGKVLTNKDVPNVPQPTPAPATPKTDASKPDQAPSSPAGTPAGDGKDGAEKDEKYWSGRLKTLQEQLDRDQVYAEAMQSRINGLTTDFVNRDDPAQRTVIANERDRALEELERLRTAIVTDQKALADFEEEARRAGVPPGWLR